MAETALRQYGKHESECFTNGAEHEKISCSCVDGRNSALTCSLCDCGLRDAIEQEDPEGEQLEQDIVLAAMACYELLHFPWNSLNDACEALVDYRKKALTVPRDPLLDERCSECGKTIETSHPDHMWRDSRGWTIYMIEASRR
jgi:hypothetical protein